MIARPLIFFAIFSISSAVFAFDIGLPPLFDNDEELSLEKKDDELRMFGPLVEISSKEERGRELAAVRPIWSREDSEGLYSFDVLWPFFAYRENDFEKYWRLFLLYSGRAKPQVGDGAAEKPHVGLVPLWFHGRDDDGEGYWALFPFYGELRDFIGYDSIYYVMFPVYLRTRKGQMNGEAWFWPIWNWDESPSFRKFRFFPFYAYHDRPGAFRRASYVWPFYHSAEYYSAKDGGGGWMLWPFYGENRFKDLKSWSVLWPFFSGYEREKGADGEDGSGFNAPWPILQYRRNVDRDEKNEKWRFYLWPLIGRSERKDSEYQFLLWPFISSQYTSGDSGDVEWVWILPFYWSKHARDRKGEMAETYRNFYPFVSILRKGNFCEIRALDLWFQRNMPAVERNWAPLWTLFNYQSTGEAFRYDFLWGLVKYFDSPEEGEGFSLQPFYRSCSRFKDDDDDWAEDEDEEACEDDNDMDWEDLDGFDADIDFDLAGGDADGPAREGVSQRDYLLGFVRTRSYSDGSVVLRLFWFAEIEF